VASKEAIGTATGTEAGVDSSMGSRSARAGTSPRVLVKLGALRRASTLEITEARGPAAGTRRDSLFRRALLVADLVASSCALSLTVVLSNGSLRPTWLSPAALAFVLVSAKLLGLYDRDEALIHKTTLDETPSLFQLATLCTLAAWLADGWIVGGSLGRGGALLLWLALLVFLVAYRVVARTTALRVSTVERCILIGDPASARTVGAKLADRCGTRAAVVAHVELDEAATWSAGVFSRERLAEIRELAQALDVHRAIVASSSADASEMLELVCTLKAVGVRVSVLPRLLEVVGSSVEFDDLHGVTLMGVRRFDMTRSTALVKRAFDLAGAALGLLVALPLMIAIAIVIKLDSPGPVFFGQLRVGRHGDRFRMLKFRTMVAGAETLRESLADRNEAQEGLFKIAEDPRITRVGAVLRKSSLDELPQLINILRGEMSLVGPRPLVVEEDMRVEGWHRRRLELLPGMTGHWQILGPARVPLHEMVAIDYLYVANWSLWSDIKILLRTVPHVVGRRGL
jgi:exopolysaccharide biosynthesis polyprenyl glycosylphosphotransferase